MGSEPIRVVHDGNFITTTLTENSFPSPLKPIIVTNVNMEAGPAIYGGFDVPPPPPAAAWSAVLGMTFPQPEVQDILSSDFYPISNDSDDIRPQLVNLGTDQIWRCPTWTLSRAWAQHGGVAYTGVFDVGSVYPDSTQFSFCTDSNVCHEGDIEIVASPTSSTLPTCRLLSK